MTSWARRGAASPKPQNEACFQSVRYLLASVRKDPLPEELHCGQTSRTLHTPELSHLDNINFLQQSPACIS